MRLEAQITVMKMRLMVQMLSIATTNKLIAQMLLILMQDEGDSKFETNSNQT